MKATHLLLFVAVLLMMMGTASATIVLTDATPYARIDAGTYSFTELYNYIVATKGQTVADTYMEEVSPGVWLVKCRIVVTSAGTGSLSINSTDGNEFRMAYVHTAGSYSYGGRAWNVKDVKLVTWSTATGAPINTGNRRVIFGENTRFENVTYDYFVNLYFGENTIPVVSNNTYVDGLTCTNWTGNTFVYGNNITVKNSTWRDPVWTTGAGGLKNAGTVSSNPVTNSRFENLTFLRIGNFTLGDSSGTYSFQTAGTNNTANNIYIDGSRYVGANLKGTNSTFSNFYVSNCTHNMVEAQAPNSVYTNFYFDYSTPGSGAYLTDSALFTALTDSEPSGNVVFQNMVISDNFRGTGGAIKLGADELTALNNYTYRNITAYGGDLYIFGAKNTRFENVTMYFNAGRKFSLTRTLGNGEYSHNIDFVDCNFSQSASGEFMYSGDVKFINTALPTIGTFTSANYTAYYPVNVRTVNQNAEPVEGATLTVSSEKSSVNYAGQDDTIASTGSDGHILNSQMLYVADFFRSTSGGYAYYTFDIAGQKGDEVATAEGVNPDSTWINVNGPLISLVIDAEGAGEPDPDFQILTYSPLDLTPSAGLNESIYFNLTTNKASTWIVLQNNTQVATGTSSTSFAYHFTSSTAGTYNITIVATNEGESISQTWIVTVGEETVIPPAAVATFIVASFVAASFAVTSFVNRRRN